MKLWWIIQICLTIFTLLLSLFKLIKFQPYFFIIDDHPLDIIILLILNCAFCLVAVIFKLAAYMRQDDPEPPRLKKMASWDLLLSVGVLVVNGYGMSLQDYRWVGCEVNTICQALSAYSWYAIAELVSASLSFFYALYMLVNILRNQHKYSSNLTHQDDGDSKEVKNDDSEDKDIEIGTCNDEKV